jgi:hypothetical protein
MWSIKLEDETPEGGKVYVAPFDLLPKNDLDRSNFGSLCSEKAFRKLWPYVEINEQQLFKLLRVDYNYDSILKSWHNTFEKFVERKVSELGVSNDVL